MSLCCLLSKLMVIFYFLGKGKHGLAECESADSSTSSSGAPAYTDCPSMYDTVKYSEI